ncbi:MAG: PA0069 family radical SAM protein [Rhizobiales bacterium]|nr:PA0069 family radical SAM protein [Hyphomicrobiales bacterium]
MAILLDHGRQTPRNAAHPVTAPAPGTVSGQRRRGRGANSNRTGRFERFERFDVDDGWNNFEILERFQTNVTEEAPKRIITRNTSPDISFDRSINPYRGCEHGCSYCYARPTHAFLGLSPGLDFETSLYAKPSAPELLESELAEPRYSPATIALGTNTDPYQPIERTRRITRRILEVLERTNHPVGIVTKSAMVTRDIDILSAMAKRGLVKVAISVTTLDAKLARMMEPRAATPERRIEALRQLSQAGIPTVAMVAPIIPGLNDEEIEKILTRTADAGVSEAGYVMLRLPLEVRDLFFEWLNQNLPGRAARVLSLVHQMRDGKDYDATWGRRQRGTGPIAWSIGRRFELATGRLGLNSDKMRLRTDLFTPPVLRGGQMRLL